MRAQRSILAAIGQLWAYWAALDRSDWLAASIVLAYFQRLWGSVRPAVIAYFPAGQQATMEAALPRAISPSGQWDEPTRTAALSVISASLGGSVFSAVGPSLPRVAGALAAWWRANLVSRFPQSSTSEVAQVLWSFDAAVREDDSASAATNVEGRTIEVVEDIAVGPAVRTTTGASTGAAVTQAGNQNANVVLTSTSGSSGSSATSSQNQSQTSRTTVRTVREPTELAETRIVGQRQSWPTWVYAAIGLGFVTFAGVAIVLSSTPRGRRARRAA